MVAEVQASSSSLHLASFIHVDPLACKQFSHSIPGDVEGCAELPQVCRQSGLMAGQGAIVQRGARFDVDFQKFITMAVVQECLSRSELRRAALRAWTGCGVKFQRA